MAKKRILPLLLAICAILIGCQQAPATPTTSSTTTSSVTTVPTKPTTVPTTLPPKPTTVQVPYFTGLDINFSGFYVTNVAVTYEEASLTLTYTSDDLTYQKTYDFKGRLLRERVDGARGYYTEEIRTYTDLSDKPQTVVFTRAGFTSNIECTFDDNGNVLTNSYTSSTGEWNTTTSTYDAENRLLTEAYVSSGGSNTLKEYTYNANGDWVTTYEYSKGNLQRAVVREFNDAGYLIREAVHAGDPKNPSSRESQTVFTVDENGNVLLEEMTARRNGWNRIQRTFDEKGNMLTEHYEDSSGYIYAASRTYNAAGLLETSTDQYGDETCVYTYEYNAAGQQTKSTCTYSDGTTSETRCTYDEKGNLLESVSVETDGSIYKEVRTYDEHGSLITYTAYSDGETVSTSCSYTYGYVELLLEQTEQIEQLDRLMYTVFQEFLPA